jgi:predicted RNase H-like HicB family nuclease
MAMSQKTLTYTVIFHPAEEGGFWVSVPALPGCFTQGETLKEAEANAVEAIQCHLEGMAKDGEAIPVEDDAPPRIERLRVQLEVA